MAPDQTSAAKQLVGLPMLVGSPVEVGRLIRELETLDESLRQAELRGTLADQLPRLSQLMDKTVELNKLDLLQAADRQILREYLAYVKQHAPVLHISFSADPAANFMEKIIAWLRTEVHPLILVTIGLQPNIGAGCVIRTPNQYFDLSLRQNFESKRQLLRESIATKVAPVPTSAVATEVAV